MTTKNQKGFNLVEAAIVLGIVGLVIGGIWVAASSVYENNRTQRASQQLITIVQQVRKLSSNAGDLVTSSADVTSSLVTAGVFPADMVQGGQPKNPWNGDVTVYGVNNAGGDTFWVNFNGLTRQGCTDIAMNAAGQSKDAGLQAYAVSNAAITDAPSSSTPATTAPTIVSLTTSSGCASTTNVNAAAFNFSLR